MKKFFTISEFARLRNININSLHYYEKLGLLKPAYVDPETKYRYYSSEQLYLLNTIRLLIDLDIPLKEMSDYADSPEDLRIRSILEDGKQIAQGKLEEIQRSLKRIEHTLEFLNANQAIGNQTGFYTRQISRRMVFTIDGNGTLEDFDNIEIAFTSLYGQAQLEGLSPVLPFGIIVTPGDGQYTYRQFFEVIGDGTVPDNVITLPEGNYRCMQMNYRDDMDFKKIIEETFPSDHPIIVSNMYSGKFNIENIRIELQQLPSS